jgi:hypothetical protein
LIRNKNKLVFDDALISSSIPDSQKEPGHQSILHFGAVGFRGDSVGRWTLLNIYEDPTEDSNEIDIGVMPS